MKILYLNIALIGLLLSIFFTPASKAYELKTCKTGLIACQSLDEYSDKYATCMKILCLDEKLQEQQKVKLAQCDYGYRKCNSLRDNPLHYWTCVDETCRYKPKAIPDHNCQAGHKQCQPRIAQYWSCMSSTCDTIYSSYKSCPRGETECATDLRTYWDCVAETCLGHVNKYRNPDYYTKKVENDEIIRYYDIMALPPTPPDYPAPPVNSVHEKFRYAPEGIDPYQWGSAITPVERQIQTIDIEQFSCANPSSSVYCHSDDISSCSCSDGSQLGKRRGLRQMQKDRIIKYRKMEIEERKARHSGKPFYKSDPDAVGFNYYRQ